MRRLRSYVVNGITVALGIALVQSAFALLAGTHAGLLATSGAVYASLADLPNTVGRSWRRVFGAALLGSATALVMALLAPHPVARGAALVPIVFLAMMTLAWGPRAGPISFAAVLAIVFTMASPVGAQPPLELFAWNVAGAAAYFLWSIAAAALLQRRYRTLALSAALEATARLFRLRAEVLEQARVDGAHHDLLRAWVAGEAVLAERLQAARDLLFAARDTAWVRRHTAVLLHTIDLRDVLLASRLDVDLLGDDEAGRRVRAHVAAGLRRVAAGLEAARDGVLDPKAVPAGGEACFAPAELPAEAIGPAGEARARLMPVIDSRLRTLADDVAAIHALLRGADEALPLSRDELQQFVAPDGWPLRIVAAQLSLRSPVCRHALRSGVALGCAYFIGLALPWASHPHWLVLSVAVVLRGNLEQTLSRRNARVLGTALGCLVVLGLAFVAQHALLSAIFIVSAGVAHAFVAVRYLLTAMAGTVMALLQAHLVDPGSGFAVAERLADTVLGALLAWAFSYVLPSWERRAVPTNVARALAALREYAACALASEEGAAVAQRLARRRAYDALGALAAAVQRGAFEPQRVRPPVRELTMLLDHGQRLMAHLSVIRLTLARHGSDLALPQAEAALRTAAAALQACLTPGAPIPPEAAALDAPLPLPALPPARDRLPWLLRRLQVSVADARAVRAAAGAAMAALRRR